jgi:hypothetical protein
VVATLSIAEQFFESLNLARPRTPRELDALAKQVRQSFNASEELRKGSRPGGRLTKKYFEEVYPLILLTRRLYTGRSDVSCEPNFDDGKSFDATVTIGSEPHSRRILIEFASAKDGQDEALRGEVLNRDGHVSLTAPLEVKGRKRTGRQILVSPEAMEFRVVRLEKTLDRIISRLDRKAGPKYADVDLLVVVYDDTLGFRKPDELAQLRDSIESSPALRNLSFGILFLLGSSGETFLEFCL